MLASPPASPTTPSVLEVRDFTKHLGGKRILDSLSLAVNKGEMKVLIGPSGAGKSTFLQCINYLIPPDKGELWLDGVKVDPGQKKELLNLRQRVGMIFQDFNLFDHLSAVENVSIALRKVKGLPQRDATLRAMSELERVGLSRRAGLYPAELSGGQKQRVAIARALAMDPEVILLDEPTSALDPELVGEVLAPRANTLLDLAHQINPLLLPAPAVIYDQGAVAKNLHADGKAHVAALHAVFAKLDSFDKETLHNALHEYVQAKGLAFKAVGPALRVALLGSGGGPDLAEVMAALGKEASLARLERSLTL
ncbi:hypothetical protein B566_EDAN019470 [Ephemera danica]|nr:hypothetical protein B566_EDAN019470 [Ephemera danica]